MGTTYKGNAQYFRSIGQNVMVTSNKYGFNNGFFGENSKHGSDRIRNIFSTDNLSTAYDFYDKIACGGLEKVINNNMRITRMADGTPAVDINIKKSKHAGGVESQKIHFVLETNK